jgi:hypothetical protein
VELPSTLVVASVLVGMVPVVIAVVIVVELPSVVDVALPLGLVVNSVVVLLLLLLLDVPVVPVVELFDVITVVTVGALVREVDVFDCASGKSGPARKQRLA